LPYHLDWHIIAAKVEGAMSDEPILETALRVLSWYIGTGNARPDPGDIALLHKAAEITGNQAKTDAIAVYIVQRELQRRN
jgi:hypothetical protein